MYGSLRGIFASTEDYRYVAEVDTCIHRCCGSVDTSDDMMAGCQIYTCYSTASLCNPAEAKIPWDVVVYSNIAKSINIQHTKLRTTAATTATS